MAGANFFSYAPRNTPLPHRDISEEVSRACKNISPSILNNIKKDINKTSSLFPRFFFFFLFSFFFFLVARKKKRKRRVENDVASGGESRVFF